MKIFVINGHKYYWYSTGKLNKTLFEEIVRVLSSRHEVKTTIIEQGYEVEKEIEKYLWADAVIYQNPVNWFSVPWLLKKYFDEVITKNIFYGPSEKYGYGGLLKGKKYMFSLTWNSTEDAFEETNGFYDMRAVDDIYLPLHKMHQFCAMEKIETYSAFDSVKHPDVERYLNKLRFHLNKYLP